MATYYKSRFLTDPIVYVQEEGLWRSYGPSGVKQVEGNIPDRLFAGLERISRAEAERFMRRGPSGLGGWLLVPIIGLFATAIAAVTLAAVYLVPVMDSQTWSRFTAPGESRLWLPYFIFEIFCSAVLFFGAIASLVLLFRKRRALPLLIICFWGFAFIALEIDALVGLLYGPQMIPDAALRAEIGWTTANLVIALVAGVILSAIWIPYFLFSARVKNTFANRPGPALRAAYAIAAIVVVLAIVAGAGTALGGAGTTAQNSGNTQTNTSGDSSAGEVIARIGDRSITSGELGARVADFEVQYAGQVPDKVSDPAGYKVFQLDVLDYMITYELAVQKAKELNITVTDADVQAEIGSILKDNFGGDQAKFDEALKQQGITIDQLRSSYKESALLQKVYDEVTKDVAAAPDAGLSDRQTAAWQAWIAQQKQAAGVTYSDGWQPTAATQATAP
jgi:Protein of unknown function (DUF2569)/SurA N-terminal domain